MKTAIITGVSRGLGAALAKQLLEYGHHVCGVGRTDNADLNADDKYRFIVSDLSLPDSLSNIEKIFSELAQEQHEQIVLINNAAIAGPAGVFGDLASTDIGQSLQLNLVSVVQLANLFCQHFAGNDCDKRIINISSGAAFTAIAGSGVYCIAKAGMEMMTSSIAAEIDHHGVVAMSIQPGVIDTDMQSWLRQQPQDQLPSVDMYQGFRDQQHLLSAETVANNVINSAVLAPPRNGQSFSHDQY